LPRRIGSAAIGGRVVVAGKRRLYRARPTLEIEMATGTVKWFNPTKGYGFIQPTGGGGKDVFVHISAVEQAGLSSLNEGQTVEYELESSKGKESAVKLKLK
jgi:CspA family cold shock protein